MKPSHTRLRSISKWEATTARARFTPKVDSPAELNPYEVA
jgi:hypothetical protein